MANRIAEHQGRTANHPGVPDGSRNRRRRRPNRLAAHQGRTPQTGVPTGPRNAPKKTKAERRNAALAAALKPKRLGATKPKTATQRRREAAAVAILRGAHIGRGIKPPRPTVATASPRTQISRGPSRDELLELAVDKDVIKPQQAARHLPTHKTVGQDIYGKIAEWAPLAITEVGPISEGVKGALAAARGAKAGDEIVGGSKFLSKVLKPTEATSAADRAAVSERAAARAAKGGSGVKAAARRVGERVARTQGKADRAVARQVAGTTTRKEAIAQAGAPLKLTKATVAQALPVVRGHEQAIAEHPGKVAKTTARAIPGLVTAPVGQAIGLGVTAGRAASEGAHALGIPGARGYSGKEILAPTAGIAREQLDFARQVAKTLTADDPKEVQKAVEDELGLLLPIALGLGAKAVADKLTKGRITEAVKRVVDDTRAAQRKQEALRVSRAGTRTRRETQDRTRQIRQEAGRAKGSEVLEGRTVRGGRIRRRDRALKVHAGDIANFLQRHAIDPLDNPTAALAEVERIGARLKPAPEGLEPPRSKITTRDVVAAIERNPHWLTDRHVAAEIDEFRKQGAHAREHAAELEPEHSERARFVPTAVTRDVPLTEERFPRSVRGIVRAAPTRGALAKDVLRRESRSDRTRERRLGRKAAKREERARAIARELKVRERAEPSWVKRNAAVRAKGERLAKQVKLYRGGALKAADQAKRKYHAATEVDPALEPEFVQEMEARLKAEGRPLPEWSSTTIAKDVPSHGGTTGARIIPFPGRSKFRSGFAEEHGLVQEDLASWLRSSVARPVSRRESYRTMRSFLEDNQYVNPAGRTEFTSREAGRIFDEGHLDRDGWALIPAQLYKRAIDPDDLAGQFRLALDSRGEIAPGRRYRIVRRPAAAEFLAQLDAKTIAPKVAAINRATSFLILGTSPAWAAAQIVAEYAQATAAQPRILNPIWARKALKAYKDLPDEKRWAFESWAGVTKGDPIAPGELHLDPRTGDLDAAANAYGVLTRTPLGRLIRSIPKSLSTLDQWKGGRVRILVGTAKIDHDVNGHLPRFLRGVRGLYSEMGKASAGMKGRPFSEQLAWVADHPEFQRRYADYLDDVMGNWHSLTRNEQIASRFLIFYPFIRMAARWTFYAFPKQHPIKAALLYYLGQQNANTLHHLLGGDPSYFTEWATVPIHLDDGKTDLLPLSRIAPGTGLVTELAGEGTKNLPGLALSSLQPGVASAIIAATGVDPSTGEQEPGRGVAALSQLLNLSPVTRLANAELTPDGQKPTDQALPVLGPLFGSTRRQKALDKLFAKLEGNEGTVAAVRRLVAPVRPEQLGHERDLVKLRQILDTISANSSTARRELGEREEERAAGAPESKVVRIERSTAAKAAKMTVAYERAQAALDRMLARYGIEADPWSGDIFGIAAYGSKPRSTGATFGGRRIPLPRRSSYGVTKIGGVVVGHAPQSVATYGGKRAVAGPRPEATATPESEGLSTYGPRRSR